MEFIATLFRALANRTRIRILRLLVVLGETTVSDIAAATSVRLSRTSAHLRALVAVGLLWRRRSGRVVDYGLAERASHPVTATVLQSLTRIFGTVTATDPDLVAAADQAGSATCSDAALFACFTAFTHPRRLQIIRHLAVKGTATSGELSCALSMSPSAVQRHVEKLQRRGFVRAKVAGRQTTYALTRGRGSAQQGLLEAVRKHLCGEQT